MWRAIGVGALGLWVVAAVGAGSDARAEHVLGADAAGTVKAWTAKLAGVKVKRIEVSKARVTVHVGEGCSLILSRPDDVACPVARSVGNTVACWVGERCPASAEATAALAAAGHLALPWLDLSSGDRRADGPEDDELERARSTLAAAMASGNREAARETLAALLASKKPMRAAEWPSLLAAAPALGLGREATEIAARPELRELGWVTLSVMRVALLRGPRLASAVGRAIVDAESACASMAIASAWLATDPGSAAELAAAAQEANPDCFAAWAIQVEGWTGAGHGALALSVADSARERFGEDPRLDALGDAELRARQAQEAAAGAQGAGQPSGGADAAAPGP